MVKSTNTIDQTVKDCLGKYYKVEDQIVRLLLNKFGYPNNITCYTMGSSKKFWYDGCDLIASIEFNQQLIDKSLSFSVKSFVCKNLFKV